MDRSTLKMMRVDINKALQSVANKYNTSMECGNARFTDTSATFKLEINEVNKDGVVMTCQRKDFVSLSKLYGLNPKWLDKTFNMESKTFKIVGFNTRARKAPIELVEVKTGKKFKCSVEAVIAKMR
jgi:hypothetical protein